MRTWLWSALALLATAATDAEQQEVEASKVSVRRHRRQQAVEYANEQLSRWYGNRRSRLTHPPATCFFKDRPSCPVNG